MIKNLRDYESRDNYPFDAVFLHGTVEDNKPLNAHLAEVVQQWNDRYDFPKIIFSHNAEFFEYVEKHYGDKLPVFRGSGGTCWEDGAASSARETALCRNAHEGLTSGETLLSLADRIRPGTRLSRRNDLRGLAELHPVRRTHVGRQLLVH